MAKHIIIHNCAECPYLGWDDCIEYYFCNLKSTRGILGEDGDKLNYVPSWCELKEVKEVS